MFFFKKIRFINAPLFICPLLFSSAFSADNNVLIVPYKHCANTYEKLAVLYSSMEEHSAKLKGIIDIMNGSITYDKNEYDRNNEGFPEFSDVVKFCTNNTVALNQLSVFLPNQGPDGFVKELFSPFVKCLVQTISDNLGTFKEYLLRLEDRIRRGLKEPQQSIELQKTRAVAKQMSDLESIIASLAPQ